MRLKISYSARKMYDFANCLTGQLRLFVIANSNLLQIVIYFNDVM